jgi:hypothetical protein
MSDAPIPNCLRLGQGTMTRRHQDRDDDHQAKEKCWKTYHVRFPPDCPDCRALPRVFAHEGEAESA